MRQAIRLVAAASSGCWLLAGCALAPPTPAPASIAVEVIGGASQAPVWPQTQVSTIAIVIDATESMTAATPAGPSRLEAARVGAQNLLESLAEDDRFETYGLGLTNGAPCVPAVRLTQNGGSRPDPSKIARRVASLEPLSEGSLAGALTRVRRDLEQESVQSPARVVVLSDFRSDCGGDICQAVRALLQHGAELDLVALGDEPLPECLRGLAAAGPPPALTQVAPSYPTFRVEAVSSAEEREVLMGIGVVNGVPVSVPPRSVFVIVEMDPPTRVGPLTLLPDTRTRVRVIDFPGLTPAVRESSWETIPRTESSPPAEPES